MENNKNILIVILIMIIFVGGIIFLNKKESNNIVSTTVLKPDITPSINNQNLKQTESSSINLNLQTKCSEQAHATFVNSGVNPNNYSYINHFSTKLNKCFMVDLYTDNNGKLYTLVDAISNQEYGEYWSSPSGEASDLTSCIQNGEPILACKIINNKPTLDDWQNFIRPYMEN